MVAKLIGSAYITPGIYMETSIVKLPRLKLLSYNIHTGVAISGYHHYLTQGWKHVLPCRKRPENLGRIADLLSSFDVVGLQEVDAGSLRSEYMNQVDFLAERAGFPFCYHQTNRRLGKIAQQSIGMLSRIPVADISEHRLPGAIPGRGALIAKLNYGSQELLLIISHLSLGKRARMSQIAYLSRLIQKHPHVILMGDLNCRSGSLEMEYLLKKTGMRLPIDGPKTFPSWRPLRGIDHILVSPGMELERTVAIDCRFSDHLPVAALLNLPNGVGSVELALSSAFDLPTPSPTAAETTT